MTENSLGMNGLRSASSHLCIGFKFCGEPEQEKILEEAARKHLKFDNISVVSEAMSSSFGGKYTIEYSILWDKKRHVSPQKIRKIQEETKLAIFMPIK